MSRSPHDALFRDAFTKPETAAAELRSVLPASLVEHIDLATLELRSGTFIEEGLDEQRTDVLYSALVADREVYLYILFEHQSTVDGWMPLRLLRYMVNIWNQVRDETPGLKRLPPILPIVVHHSDTGWTASQTFGDLLDVPEPVAAALRPFIPDFRFVLDDLSHLSDEAIQVRPMDPMGHLVLLFLRSSRWPDFITRLAGWAELLAALRRGPEGSDAMVSLLVYIHEVTEKSPEEVTQAMAAAVSKAESAIVTSAQILEQRGWQKGRTEGRTEGRVEGRGESLLAVLSARGFKVSAAVRERVMGCADVSILDAWLVRAVTAPSIEDVFSS